MMTGTNLSDLQLQQTVIAHLDIRFLYSNLLWMTL